MKNPKWQLYQREHREGLQELLNTIINVFHPKHDQLIGMLYGGSNFSIWIEHSSEKSNEHAETKWVAKTENYEKFGEILAKKSKENIVPIGLNNNEEVWYLECLHILEP